VESEEVSKKDGGAAKGWTFGNSGFFKNLLNNRKFEK